jgi:hypothetical protein
MMVRAALLVLAIALLANESERTRSPSRACSLCSGYYQQQQPTLRQSAGLSKFVVMGTLTNARLIGEKGATDFRIEEIVVPDPAVEAGKVLTIPAYVPTDPKRPQRYLLFGEFVNGKLVIEHSCQVAGAAASAYVKAALEINERDRVAVLEFCYKHLDAEDATVAADAYHEFAKATDAEIAQAARKLAPDKLRRLLKDPKTAADRLGMYAYLLGACGQKDDVDLLLSMIRKRDERGNAALSGLLCGLIELRPDLGWPLIPLIVGDPQRPFEDKISAHAALRFYRASKPTEGRKEILRCMEALIGQGELADMAIEDLCRWQWWDLTPAILARYSKPTHSAQILRSAIIRYALSCPGTEAAEFIKARRLAEPAVVSRAEQSLDLDKPFPAKKNP